MKFRTLFLLILIVAAGYTGYRIYHKPYDVKIEVDDIPIFTKYPFDFAHDYDQNHALPITGSAIIDVNNDNIPEVFIGGGYLQRDALFKFHEGEFINISNTSGLAKENYESTTYGAATIDANQDGQADLFIARNNGVYLYTNKDGFFTGEKLDLPIDEKSVPISIALTDLNQDGYVDMFVSCYITPGLDAGQIFNNKDYGANSLLLLNNGNNTFKDITDEAGIKATHNTFTAVFADLNEDRLPDLVIAYNTGNVVTYKNTGDLKFEKILNPTTDSYSYPMSLATGDYNNDGKLDIFASNIGSTIPAFLARGDLRESQVLNTKWMLLRNDGNFNFTDTANKALIADYEFGWGAVFTDFNLDGLQDLIVEGNYIKFPPHQIYRNPGKLLIQKADHTFAPAETLAKIENRFFGISPLIADFNNDGYPDLIHVNIGGPSYAFINNGGANNYLIVNPGYSPESLGATITLETGVGKIISEQIISGEGLASDQSHIISFGIGFETSIKLVTVKYLSGKTLTFEKPEINSILDLRNNKTSDSSAGELNIRTEDLDLLEEAQENIEAPPLTESTE